MSSFKRYVTCIMSLAFFILFTCVALCQFYLFMSHVLFPKYDKLWNERKQDCFFLYGCFSVLRYIKTRMFWDIKLPWSKEVENRIFRRNRIFRHTCMYKQPILTKYHIFVQKLHSHFRYTDRLRYTDVFSCCSLQYYQSFMRNHEGKIELQKKVHKRKIICCLKLNMYIFF